MSDGKAQGFLHVGRLEQQLGRLGEQINQLRSEVESVAALPESSPVVSSGSLEELRHSLTAEILRLESELNQCEADLLSRKTAISLESGLANGDSDNE